MILVTIAAVGAAAGVLGLTVAVFTHARATRMVSECDRLVRRRLKAGTGPTDGRALRDVALVHYDALEEMSGQLSFSLALLDATGDGVVLTSINGRTETRTYAKAVEAGATDQQLSPEERQALRAARFGQRPRAGGARDDHVPAQLSAGHAPVP